MQSPTYGYLEVQTPHSIRTIVIRCHPQLCFDDNKYNFIYLIMCLICSSQEILEDNKAWVLLKSCIFVLGPCGNALDIQLSVVLSKINNYII